MLFGVRVYPAHCRVFPYIPDYYALDVNSMVPVVTTKKCLQMSNFLLETIGLGWELLFYIYSNLQYCCLFSPCWKPSRPAEENPEVKAEVILYQEGWELSTESQQPLLQTEGQTIHFMAELPFNDSLISIIFYQGIFEALLTETNSTNLQGEMEILQLDCAGNCLDSEVPN